MQTTQTQQQIPGIPLWVKALGWRQVQPGEYNMMNDGSICRFSPRTPSTGYALVVAPDNVYNAIDLKAVPLPEGWEYDGDAERPETWYREITVPSTPSKSGVGIVSGQTVLGFDGHAYEDHYVIDGGAAHKYRIFLRRKQPPLTAYGIPESDLCMIPTPSGWERDGSSTAEWFRYPRAGENYITINPSHVRLYASTTYGADYTGYHGTIGPRIIIRQTPPPTKQVLVGEWVIRPATAGSHATDCDLNVAQQVLARGIYLQGDGASLCATEANFRIETRPA